MGAFSLKIKTKKGQHIISNLCDKDTIGSLKEKIAELTKIGRESINILCGFPPRQLDYSNDNIILSELKIVNGDTLIIDEKPIAATTASSNVSNDSSTIGERLQNDIIAPIEGILLKKVVPSDNSCLFTSIGTYIICILFLLCSIHRMIHLI